MTGCSSGDVFTITLVIPEGYNIFDVADAVQAAKLGTRDDFFKSRNGSMRTIGQAVNGTRHAPSVEGFLFPDTYKFGRHATPVQILTAMVKRFGAVAAKLGIQKEAMQSAW